MQYSDISARLSELYLKAWSLCLLHPLRTDAVIVIAVSYILMIVLSQRYRRRHKLYRLLWGAYMKRADRARYHMKLFEDAIVDVAMDAVQRGDMTEREEAEYYQHFAEVYGMRGLQPSRSIKKGIQSRLKTRYSKKSKIPGPPPQVKADPTYVGTKVYGLAGSKYATTE